MNYVFLNRAINCTSSFYRTFDIPKRRGGVRTISTPLPMLLVSQRWILDNILSTVEISSAAHGFVRGRSVVTNATVHAGKKSFLKMDISDFFPSISINRVVSIFRRFGYTQKLSYALAALCCLNGRLPQGAATSPMISNIVAKKFDGRLGSLAKSFNLSYTRYADDLTFSGETIPIKIINYIKNIVEDEKFRINEDKTVLATGRCKKIVTGISVSEDTLKLPKETKRQLRQELHYLTANGFLQHTETIGNNDPLYIESLLGKFSFWRQVEPENEYVRNGIESLRKIQRIEI